MKGLVFSGWYDNQLTVTVGLCQGPSEASSFAALPLFGAHIRSCPLQV